MDRSTHRPEEYVDDINVDQVGHVCQPWQGQESLPRQEWVDNAWNDNVVIEVKDYFKQGSAHLHIL